MSTIVIANHAGGVAKTTTAGNIAVEFALRGHKTLLISDRNGDSIRMLFPRFKTFFLGESEERWLKLRSRFQIPAPPCIFATDIEGLHICSNHVHANYTLLRNKIPDLDLDLAALNQEYSVIIIDSAPAINPFTIEGWYMQPLLRNAHILVPVRHDYHTSLEGAKWVLNDLLHAQTFLEGISLLGAVITGFTPNRRGVNLGKVK